MKKYKEYMDTVKASNTLHQKLKELGAPKKQRHFSALNKYSGVAAVLALALLAGPALYSLTRPEPLQTEMGDLPGTDSPPGDIDIAIDDPDGTPEPGQTALGGYEVKDGEMTAYYAVPAIYYGMTNDMAQLALDWDLPKGSVRRDLTGADIAALFSQEENLSLHLGWSGYTLTGWAAWYEDGSLWGAYINGHKGELDSFEFAFTAGDTYPPTCICYGDGKVNELWWDTPVTAYGYDGKDACSRRVEFMKGGYGFRFDVTGTDTEQACWLASLLVRYLCDCGAFDGSGSFVPDALTPEGATLAHPYEAGPSYSVGEPNWNDGGSDVSPVDLDGYLDPGIDGQPDTAPDAEAAGPVEHSVDDAKPNLGTAESN